MGAAYCIPPTTAQMLVDAIKSGDVIGDIGQLYEMTSKERRDSFAKHVDKETAQLINAGFEKAMLSNQKNALQNWVKKTFNTEAKKNGQAQTVLDKIGELDEQGLLTPENTDKFLEDLVTDKLGISITPKEAEQISELSRQVEEASKIPNGKYGPDIKYWEAKKKFDNYADSLTPTPKLRIATSVIGRATMLFSIKSPIVNIESNTVNAISEGFNRRVETLAKSGVVPASTVPIGYVNYVNKVYRKTGYDISRMITMEDGRKRLGEEIIHSQGKGVTRAVGRFYTDIVFNKLMTAPDVAFSSVHFADSGMIHATIIARSEGVKGKALKARAEQIFTDAAQIIPKTPQGQIVREKARLEAERGTYTNKNNYSKTALALRGVLNTASGDLRFGDNLMPFVKVPATVIGTSIDYSGVLLPVETFITLKNALNAKKAGDSGVFRSIFTPNYIRKVTRAGLGITTAMILSSWFDPEEFIGEYPTTEKERELFKLKKARENSVKIGGKWISLDYFGPLAAPFVGMMTAKKYGTDPIDAFLKYNQGTLVQASRIPGFRDFTDMYDALVDLNPTKSTPEELKEQGITFIADLVRSRTLPAFVSDFAKATDQYERQVEKNDFIGRFMMNIPELRKNLPEKVNIFGEKVTTEGFWGSLLFGSRVKQAGDDKLVNELSRLADKQLLPSVTDVSRTSERAKQLKEQIGDQRFRKFYSDFGTVFKQKTLRLIDSGKYRRANDEKKQDLINEVKSKQFDKMLKKHGYKKPKK